EGRSMKEVASMLSIATRTVAFHKYQMMEQLQLKTSAQLIHFAVRQHPVFAECVQSPQLECCIRLPGSRYCSLYLPSPVNACHRNKCELSAKTCKTTIAQILRVTAQDVMQLKGD